MTQELLDLKMAILNNDADRALEIVQELETMDREDQINNIQSYLVVLMVHLLKIEIENRIINSWRSSILNSLLRIQRLNRMGNKKTPYIKSNRWEEYILEILPEVYLKAATEINEGQYSDSELETLTDEPKLINTTISFLKLTSDRNPSLLKQTASKQLENITYK